MRSKNAVSVLLSILVLVAAAALAGNGPGGGSPGVDPSRAFAVSGEVVAFSADPGSGLPTLLVDDPALGEISLRLGPVWYLQEQGFTAAQGDQVDALAYPCVVCPEDAVAAWVNDVTSGTSVELRDEDGVPLWTALGGAGQGAGDGGQGSGEGGSGSVGGHGGPGGVGGHGEPAGPHDGQGPGGGSGPFYWHAPDMTRVTTVTGVVTAFEGGVGTGSPLLALETAEATLSILVSPFHLLDASGLVIEPGMELVVTYAPVVDDGTPVLLAIAVTDPVTGLTVQLRDPETGLPLSGGSRRSGPRHAGGR